MFRIFNNNTAGQIIYLSRRTRHLNIFLVFIILFVYSSKSFPQNPPYGRLSVEDGLSSNAVNCMLQDHLGFLWFGTEDGLNRFDGYEVKVYRHNRQDTNSISDNSIWSLFEDKYGFLWIGTNNGEINRYDHRTDNFQHWKIKSENTNENRITCIYEDNDGLLWIGTYKNGLYRFDQSASPHLLEHWQYQPDNPNSLSNYWITSILQDIDGDIWIGTYNGLNKFNPMSQEKPFIRYGSDPKNPNSISDNLVWNLAPSVFDPEMFWICTLDGLTKYNKATGIFTRHKLPDNIKSMFANSTSGIVEQVINNEKILWVGTYGGLLQINPAPRNSYKRFSKEDNNPFGLISNQINAIIKDNSNVLWIATENGINFISHKSMQFNHSPGTILKNDEMSKLDYKNVKAISQSSVGTLWFGTEAGLYNTKEINKGAMIGLNPEQNILNVWSLCYDDQNKLWIGTFGDGIKLLDLKNHALSSWNLNNSDVKMLPYNFVKAIFQDRQGLVWFGFWGNGLARYNPQTNKHQFWQNENDNPSSISYNDVWTIYQDSKDRIWIGTNGGGLNLFLPKKTHDFEDTDGGTFYCLSNEPNSDRNKNNTEIVLSNNNIHSICEATRGKYKSSAEQTTLWIGTSNGLNKLVISEITNEKNVKNSFNPEIDVDYFTVEDGLPDNAIKSILEDEDGNLWIGTNAGISLLDVERNTFTNFTVSDGLKGSEFNSNAAFRLSDGTMILGSTAGLNIFDPKEIKQSKYSPPVLITGFQIFNQGVGIGKDSPLKANIPLAKEIILSHDQNVFSFQFSAFDFNSSKSNQYAYMMEGFDNAWIYSGSRRYVTYTNLEPGDYLFKVKATNSDGIWSKNEASLKVLINPPWWKTNWAYALYVFLIVAGLFAIRRFQVNRAELRNELKMREFEAKKHQELENLKSRFFANLSHEFRTPLMLIKGPVEQLLNSKLKGKIDEQIEQLQMIQRNSQKLKELIDQLLELSQLEAAAIPLKAKQENIINVTRGIASSFESLASQKNIKLIINSSEEMLCVWIDRDKFEKIMNNLLSNAFKFTEDGGTVSVLTGLDDTGKNAEIKISDTGIGIPEDHIDRIFNRFYQVDDSSKRAFGGSGIGLALVKELVDLHRCNITVQSEFGKGTEFTISIPYDDSYLEEKEKIYEKPSDQEPALPADVMADTILSNENIGTSRHSEVKLAKRIETTINKVDKPIILIVEDSSDVRKYLSGLLEPYYKLSEAENGDEGLKSTAEIMPDLIISDIMMPHMDGIEFCRHIKTNWETSHIPIILLTAKASSENKIEGLETGADDYLTKPFDSKELLIRVKNLLEQRKRLKEKFSKEIKITAEAISTNSLDNEFLNKAFKVAEKNLANTEFDSEVFAEEMFVSRSQLHRKIIAVTGQPPGEFIRSYRLKRAAQLLIEKKMSITQVAFEVGFSDPSYFTKAFRQQFGCLPSEFSSKAQVPVNREQ